jgi:outer membrane protein
VGVVSALGSVAQVGRLFRSEGLRALAIAGAAFLGATAAQAQTLDQALVEAYKNNPTLNAQRASVRATDEGVPQALAGYRPKISATGTVGEQYSDTRTKSQAAGATVYSTLTGTYAPASVGVTATQTLFNGFQTANRTRQAEALVLVARETLRNTEQATLLNAATAYMNLLRDTAILNLNKRNVEVLEEGLRTTNDRFNVGEVTRTDVAQSESRLAQGRSQVLTSEANVKTSAATYRQVIGAEPGKLAAAMPVDRFSPTNLNGAIGASLAQHPVVTTAQHNVDAALLAVKVAEGALYPSLSVTASAQKNWMTSPSTLENFSGSVTGTMSVPLYQGGSEYSLIRQYKETLGQRRIDLDTARDQTRQTVVQSWGQLEAAKGNIEATQSQVTASEIALNGVREEARVGQRTTLDVLNAQQELLNARVSLVTAQRDRVVASYTLLSAVGRLSPQVLGLKVPAYDARVHYHQVRDSWFGVRTPDGR